MSGSKLPLLIVFVTVFIDLLGFGIVLPLLPRYAEFYHATDLQLGLLISSFSAMQFIFAPLWGRVSDRVGRRPILLLGLLGSTCSYALFSYVSQLEQSTVWLGLDVLGWLFVSRIAAGIAGATIPTAQAYIADSTEQKDRGKGMALIGVAFGIGFVFGPLIGAISLRLNDAPDWRPGAVAAALSGIAFLFALLKLPESLRPGSKVVVREPGGLKGLSRILARHDLLLLMATMFLTTLAFAQFESTLSRLTETMGMGGKSNYFVFAFLGMVLLISQGLLVRRLLPKWGEFRMAAMGAVLMAAGLPLVGLAGWSSSINQLYLVLPFCVIGFAALNPSLQASLSLRTSDHEQGEVLGYGQSASALARILGPLSGNYLFGISHVYPYIAGGLLMVVGLMCVWMTGRGAKPADEKQA
ncbi:MAG: MFS transporter [Planctomycetota bacterium]